MLDLTFLIPTRIETEDRLRNIISSVSYLLKHIPAKVIVKEVVYDDPVVYTGQVINKHPEVIEHPEIIQVPDTEQDWLTEIDEVEFLKKGTDEFKQAKKEIKKNLA